MKAVYIKENNDLKYFLFTINTNIEKIEKCYFTDIQTIKNDAFKSVKNLERIYFNEKLQTPQNILVLLTKQSTFIFPACISTFEVK